MNRRGVCRRSRFSGVGSSTRMFSGLFSASARAELHLDQLGIFEAEVKALREVAVKWSPQMRTVDARCMASP